MSDEEYAVLAVMADWPIGRKVRKVTGDYQLDGIVAGWAWTSTGKLRIVVDHAPAAPGMLHIYSPANLKVMTDEP